MAEAQLPNGMVPGHRARVPRVRRWLPRRAELGRRDHPDAAVPLRGVRRHAHDPAVLPADAARTWRISGPRRRGGILRGDLGDWVAGDGSTPAEATGTYAYHTSAKAMAEIARVFWARRGERRVRRAGATVANAYNARFFNPVDASYTTNGPAGTTGSQALDAFALEMDIVPSGEPSRRCWTTWWRASTRGIPTAAGPHISGGTVSLQPIYRVLMATGGRAAVGDDAAAAGPELPLLRRRAGAPRSPSSGTSRARRTT